MFFKSCRNGEPTNPRWMSDITLSFKEEVMYTFHFLLYSHI